MTAIEFSRTTWMDRALAKWWMEVQWCIYILAIVVAQRGTQLLVWMGMLGKGLGTHISSNSGL